MCSGACVTLNLSVVLCVYQSRPAGPLTWMTSPAQSLECPCNTTSITLHPRFLEAAAEGAPLCPRAHWPQETPVTRTELRVIPYSRVPSETAACSCPPIGPSSCRSPGLALNTVRPLRLAFCCNRRHIGC